MNRRNFLRGLLATAATPLLRDDRVVTMLPRAPDWNSVTFTSYFKWNCSILADDWRYVTRIANIETTSSAGTDLFALLSPVSKPRGLAA